MRTLRALLVGALLAGPGAADSGIRLVSCPAGTCVAVALAPEVAAALADRDVSGGDWKRVFPVRTQEAATADPVGPTLFGSYALEGDELVFRPRLPLLPGNEYQARVDLTALQHLAGIDLPPPGPDLELAFRLPTAPREVPRVVAIHHSKLYEQLKKNLTNRNIQIKQKKSF